MNKSIDQRELAGIEYHGLGGVTRSCLDAIVRLIHFGDQVHEAWLLSHSGKHCFLLVVNYDDLIAIKSGFSSGYRGEGPGGLSVALQLLERHGAEIEEYQVTEEFLLRLDNSCLLSSDLEAVKSSRPMRPSRWRDYAYDYDQTASPDNKKLRDQFPNAVPYGLIDRRLVDLALTFLEQPDISIISGYRRLEDIVRERSGLASEHGVKLFSKAFQVDDSILYWKDIDTGEHKGRGALFTATYMAFRNRRAHREPDVSHSGALREFLLLNELFLLEAEAITRPDRPSETESPSTELA